MQLTTRAALKSAARVVLVGASLVVGIAPVVAAPAAGGANSAGGPVSAAKPAEPTQSPLSDAVALGKLMFFDPSLSASGKMSCASCYSPEHAYGPPNGLAAQLGGADAQARHARRAELALRPEPYADVESRAGREHVRAAERNRQCARRRFRLGRPLQQAA